VTIDPANFHLRVEGIGPRTFVLFNGAGQSLHTWDLVVPAFLDRGKVIRFDVPGVGQSPAPDEPYSFEELGDAVLELTRPHRSGPMIVVGHAWGARAAQVLARDHPSQVAGVVIGSNGARFPPLATEDELKVLFDPAAADGGTWAQRFEQVYCAPDFAEREPERSQWLFQLVRSTPRDPALVGAAVARTPPEAYLGRFGCPALLLYGAEDRIGHRRNAEDLHRQCPKSKLVYVQDAGHFVIAEQPERFAEEVLIWVEEAGL